jgi:hypothetical protein
MGMTLLKTLSIVQKDHDSKPSNALSMVGSARISDVPKSFSHGLNGFNGWAQSAVFVAPIRSIRG